jgi:hypothetical protein
MPNVSRLQTSLARALRPFARVEPGEAVTTSVMTLAAFLLLTSYYLLKTVREPLILLHGGAEAKLYARAAQAVLMVGVVHVYGEVARRVGRLKLLGIVFLFFTSNLVVFAALARAHVSIGLAFFLWVGLFSYTAVAQFWALAADIHSEEQGKRLFPVLGIGSSPFESARSYRPASSGWVVASACLSQPSRPSTSASARSGSSSFWRSAASTPGGLETFPRAPSATRRQHELVRRQ